VIIQSSVKDVLVQWITKKHSSLLRLRQLNRQKVMDSLKQPSENKEVKTQQDKMIRKPKKSKKSQSGETITAPE
tara:strand:+ start:397 stop:618 length:222 start_codon:yes stop_codon:yes gene_type:complete